MSIALMYRLVDADLLRRLMQRTGTGAPISVRGLADASGVPRSTIDHLLNGGQERTSDAYAHAITRTIGVDLLILFEPTGRSTTGDAAPRPATVSA